MNFDLQRFNADFRYRMTRIRENAEPIALYHGEPDEERGLRGAFGRVYGNWWLFMKYNKRLNWLTSFYGQVAQRSFRSSSPRRAISPASFRSAC